ncbi:hypothetical protein [Rhizobium tubonense]|uniref:KTSC domain-containing protein n=1 Tax=Rhizobium tubonense TaxID=484088 RepID=A0A2W4F6T4_9HYPH|nr:hypothetical protein [Rhizobium tubonense]PZM17273.1 hypothetical protein CPY51_00250 [Rhizobium tubonense]
MKKIVLLGLLAVSAMTTPALAINRYNSMSYTCSQAQALVGRERAVIFRYNSGRTNLPLYDRFVADRDSCDIGFYADRSYIPTKDSKSCPVNSCVPGSDYDER